ncbi:hypothetical protein V1264_013614 [Littorina saxatilis]|uniref:Apple domain-containing protein n=1 Tax=Littorina saxatilis TaxID=31220 RepID=A0AAN9BTT9_9CAEN
MTVSSIYFVAVACVSFLLCSATQNETFEMFCPTQRGCFADDATNELTSVTTQSLVSCAMTCVSQNGSTCQAVTYIEDTGQCQLWNVTEPAVAVGSIGFRIHV